MEIQEMRMIAKFLAEEIQSQNDADLAPKWESGTVKFVPYDKSLKEHDIPIEKMLHKIIMMRDNLRVLEMQINSNKEISDGEKIKLQSYITRCYGSLTSFNFIFRNDDDKF
jgi:hypothetical protein